MKVRAIEICQLLGGTLEGNPEEWVSKPAKIEEGCPEAISFLANPKYEDFIYTCQSSVILVSNDFKPKMPIAATLIRVADVYSAVGILLQHFQNAINATAAKPEVSPQAFVHPSAQIAEGASVDAFAYIGAGVCVGSGCRIYPHVFLDEGASVGKDSTLHSGVKVYKNCTIGNRSIIHANAVIGADGFGFAPQPDGSFKKIPQLGIVEIGDDVEIGANTTIDRATMDKTVIANGAKIDNLVQVGHNTYIGEHTVIAAQAGIAGSTKIGKYCMVGGQAGFVGHISIADGTKIQAQSGVVKSINLPNTAMQGSPALPYADSMRVWALTKNLPQMEKRLQALERKNKQT